MNEVYNKIESLCKSKNVDITTMCKEAQISRAILSEFKMGRTKKLSTATLSKLSNYFGVSVDYLIGNEQNEKPATESDELSGVYFNFAKEAQKQAIDPDDIKLAIETIKRLRNKD